MSVSGSEHFDYIFGLNHKIKPYDNKITSNPEKDYEFCSNTVYDSCGMNPRQSITNAEVSS